MLTCVITGSYALGGRPADVAAVAHDDDLGEELAAHLDEYMTEGQLRYTVLEVRQYGLLSSACWNDWRRLCAADAPRQSSGFWRSLDGLGRFFDAYLFGGLKDNYPLESIFSTFGEHIEDEQSAALKEALVIHTLALAPERERRKDGSMRVPSKSDGARARYERQRAEREAAGI